jgi:hypothetical protein
MRRAALAVSLVFASANAHAHAHARAHLHARVRSFFLAGDPHVPLAVVTDGRIDDRAFSRHCGARRRWKTLGTRWKALDAWGRPMGVYTATSKDDYDATECSELSLSPRLANDLTHVFVSVDSAWRPPASAEWAAPAPKRAALASIAKTRIPDTSVPKAEVWTQCTSIRHKSRFFHVPGRGDWAIATSNAGWLVARDDASGWTVRSEDHAPKTPYSAECFRPVAVFDMNGDGVPEIVLRASGGDGWNDVVLALGRDDRWHVVAVSRGGSTA